MSTFQTKVLPDAPDYCAPDGSEIRLLAEVTTCGLCHCTLPPGGVSKLVFHRTVGEIWYCLDGHGQMFRSEDGSEHVVEVRQGVSLSIPAGVHFQFRNTADVPLRFIIATSPPWPGSDEAAILDESCWPCKKQ